MNMVLITLSEVLKQIADGFCTSAGFHGSSAGVWRTSVLLFVLFSSLCLQFIGLCMQAFAYSTLNSTFNKPEHAYLCLDICLDDCNLIVWINIASSVLYLYLLIIAVCVGSRTYHGQLGIDACGLYFVYILPLLSMIPGILSFICCFIVVRLANECFGNSHDYYFASSFYGYLISGCMTMTLLVFVCGYISGKSRLDRQCHEVQAWSDVCGYISGKSRLDRQCHEVQAWSDDLDSEVTPILPSRTIANLI